MTYLQDGGEQPWIQRPWIRGILDILQEAVEGGTPGQGTSFLDGTAADGTGNHGLIATLAALNAQQASDPTALGLSVAAHAAHMAFHLEVGVRWEQGERGPFDWKGSFGSGQVTAEEWNTLQARVQAAYEALVEVANRPNPDGAPEDAAGGLAGAAAHVAYHLGAVRQTIKLLQPRLQQPGL
ncbi:DinB family protein [Deinococcus altitudinis]|uniref:DinB family protein n=1 Tax=Deinococcus altitudinis TaxID=468914 RepID=UPI003891A4D0